MAKKDFWISREAAWTLWNPTNEDFDLKYAGRSFVLAAGDKMEDINEACKNHLLNGWGSRGLVALGYSDIGHEEEIGEAAKRANVEFKKKQIRIYNETNEQRKLSRMGYLPPPKKVRDYALELGIQLLETYTLKDEEKTAIAQTSIENEKLKIKQAMQEAEISELKDMLKQLLEQKTEQKVDKKVRCKICNKYIPESEIDQHTIDEHEGK